MASGQDLGAWDPLHSKKMLKRSSDECSNITGNELERVVIVNNFIFSLSFSALHLVLHSIFLNG